MWSTTASLLLFSCAIPDLGEYAIDKKQASAESAEGSKREGQTKQMQERRGPEGGECSGPSLRWQRKQGQERRGPEGGEIRKMDGRWAELRSNI